MKNIDPLNTSKSYEEGFGSALNTISKKFSKSEKPYQNDGSKEPVWKCRHVVTLMAILVSMSINLHRTMISVVIVAMVNNTAINQNSKVKSESCPDLIPNVAEKGTTSHPKPDGEFIWSTETQGYILSCFFFGQLFTQIPAGRMAERYGCKWIIVGSLLITSILSILIPPFSWVSTFAVMAIQILRGLAQGMLLPCVTILIANWSPENERGFLYSLVQASFPLGSALGHIIAGYICESSGGWPYVLYSVGFLGLLLVGCILFYVAENPKEHPRISKAELNFILSQQKCKLSRRRPEIPWRQMVSSVPVYASIFGLFARFWMFSQFWNVHPTFLGTILYYPIYQNGFFSATPCFVDFFISVAAAIIAGYAERAGIVSVSFLRKFCVFFASLSYSLFLLGVYIVGCNRELSTIFSVLSMGFSGVGSAGFFVVIQDMSPTFAGTLFSIASTIGMLACVILPVVVGYLTHEMQTLEQWNKVFFISIGVVMTSAIIFTIFGSAETQPWNFVEDEKEKKEESLSENLKNNEVTRF